MGRHPDAHKLFVREALRLQQLRHPHIVSFFGVRQAARGGAGAWAARLRADAAHAGAATRLRGPLARLRCPCPWHNRPAPLGLLQLGWPPWNHFDGILRR